jgi:hypothetical protein
LEFSASEANSAFPFSSVICSFVCSKQQNNLCETSLHHFWSYLWPIAYGPRETIRFLEQESSVKPFLDMGSGCHCVQLGTNEGVSDVNPQLKSGGSVDQTGVNKEKIHRIGEVFLGRRPSFAPAWTTMEVLIPSLISCLLSMDRGYPSSVYDVRQGAHMQRI